MGRRGFSSAASGFGSAAAPRRQKGAGVLRIMGMLQPGGQCAWQHNYYDIVMTLCVCMCACQLHGAGCRVQVGCKHTKHSNTLIALR